MKKSGQPATWRIGATIDRVAVILAGFFALDRALKLAAVVHFFARAQPADPQTWPSVTLLSPVTHGASRLHENLLARLRLDYPTSVQHLLICDAADAPSQVACRDALANQPQVDAQVLFAEGRTGVMASKIEKLQVALPHAHGDVLCFVDDDVALRADALRILVRALAEPRAGATFGLACYTGWEDGWSSLMSAFVNANALLSYIPLTYLCEPFTITGHCFALRRDTFERVGGFDGMVDRIDDDHELAFRLRRAGLRAVQTPMIYDVSNELGSRHAYAAQMKRWFTFPRAALMPFLSPWERTATALGSLGNLLPPLIAVLALLWRRRSGWVSLAVTLALFAVVQALLEARVLSRRMPVRRWPLLLVVALVTPLHIAWILRGDTVVEWRGQRLRIARGGRFEVVGAAATEYQIRGCDINPG